MLVCNLLKRLVNVSMDDNTPKEVEADPVYRVKHLINELKLYDPELPIRVAYYPHSETPEIELCFAGVSTDMEETCLFLDAEDIKPV